MFPGVGCSGTFALVDGADKTGTRFEDAIETAIIAMNEPKEISVRALQDYLGKSGGLSWEFVIETSASTGAW